VCSSKRNPERSDLKLSKFQKDVLVGILLGDAHLESRNNVQTFRLKIEQSENHQSYVQHLYEVFEPWVNSPPRRKTRRTKDRSETISFGFQTVTHSAFRFYFHQFYQAGEKRVPKLIHRWLTPRAISYWFMDDGSIKSKQSKGVLFNTQGFLRADVEQLAGVLSSEFHLLTSLRKQREGFQIYVSGKSYETFVGLIEAHVLKEMRYKIPPPRKRR